MSLAVNVATVVIDGTVHEVRDGQNLLQAGLSLGLDIPYFCWHPALGSVGACRQCAVKQFRSEQDAQGTIVMACMVPVADGLRVSIDDAEAREFRAAVIEWLMANHPHDCPVCDEGGECHLQDMTVMTGHVYRRHRFRKRTYRNQYLGPFINHEMNRCIQCYRCVRFYRGYAGGRDLDVFGAHDHVYFGRQEDGVLENEFSGNLVEVCPTGVFTDRTLKEHYTRKWDMTSAPGVCVHCGLGCNTSPCQRYGSVRRVLNRYHDEVNGHFLCDRGRFGYAFANGPDRIRRPRVARREPRALEVSPDEALDRAADLLAGAKRLAGIGSPRASLEANFALRALVGAENFSNGMERIESEIVLRAIETFRSGLARPASLRDVESCDAVLVLGEDVMGTAPRLALSLRQAARNQPIRERVHGIPLWHDDAVREVLQDATGPFFIAAYAPTRLDSLATRVRRGAPETIARLAFAVAGELDPAAPRTSELGERDLELAGDIARALRDAERPLVVTGAGSQSRAVFEAAREVAGAIARSRGRCDFAFAAAEANSTGAGLLSGISLDEMAERFVRGEADAVVVLENDVFRRLAEREAEKVFAGVRSVALDFLATRSTESAGVVLPAATPFEADGVLVSSEGRAQRFSRVLEPEGSVRASWRWLRDLIRRVRPDGEEVAGWECLEDVHASIARALPELRGVEDTGPPAELRIAGQRIPRQPHRYSGRTAQSAHVTVHEPPPPADVDSPLAFSMEGVPDPLPVPLRPRFWAPGWNSIQALHKFQSEAGGPLRWNVPGVRLLDGGGAPEVGASRAVPPKFEPRPGKWLLLPLHRTFGSEELSARAPAVRERIATATLVLLAGDADALGLRVGDGAMLDLEDGTSLRVTLGPSEELERGTAGLPVGLPGAPVVRLPAWASIRRAGGEGPRGSSARELPGDPP